MITIRKSAERGHADHGWLVARHSFSFADYYDPQHMGFRSLRVINEDRVAPGMGFGTHPHRDMEIITYVISGALQHADSMGHKAVMRAGDVQRISAGTGITHSEFNASRTEEVHLLQIWLTPERKGVTPDYTERSFGDATGLTLVSARGGRDGAIAIHQDADLWLGKLGAGEKAPHSLAAGRHAWVQVFGGALTLNGTALGAGDAAAVSDERELDFAAADGAQFLLFDLA
jgi:quercetin 2,3-dioxygenase